MAPAIPIFATRDWKAPHAKTATTTPSCSSQTAAPVNASSLANGTYTYLVTGSSLGTVWGTGTYTDDDNDGMSDVCETTHGFNPLNASDGGSTDTDNDGISNVAECRNGTDPKTRTSLVDKGIPMVGFDYEYKVYGKMNSNDLYVARDPGAAGVPGVAGFYLRVNTDGDEPQYYNLVHPISRADAAKDGFTENTNHGIKLRDLNGDGAQDAVITGLEDSALGRWDVIVYARASVPKISGYSFASRNGLPMGWLSRVRSIGPPGM